MAGVAENIQVVSNDKSASVFDGELSPTDLTFNLSGTDNASLQELIDSELALRIGGCMQSEVEEPEGEPEEPLVDVAPVRVVQPVSFVATDPSERFIEVEKCHTAATLNVFSDTIDLSPTSDFVPFPPCSLPQEDIAKSPDQTAPEKTFSSGSDDSPVTEDLEPIPLFTQTITSDHEQSPLTEVNPFIVEELVEVGSDKDPPIDEVLVVIEPPDDATPVSDSPDRVFSPVGEITVEEIDSDNLVDISDPNLVVESIEQQPVSDHEEPAITVESQPLLDLEDQPVIEPEIKTVEIEDPAVAETLVETDKPVEFPSEDGVDASVSVCNSMPVVSNPVCSVDSEWTTVEDATKEIQCCEAAEHFEPQESQLAEDIPPLHEKPIFFYALSCPSSWATGLFYE
ncbi:hypothetical protein J6590_049961 [Homalodisca vitripennis]|nr:hypothetical protein J6590_049961 [Homalodisca vitripennis]